MILLGEHVESRLLDHDHALEPTITGYRRQHQAFDAARPEHAAHLLVLAGPAPAAQEVRRALLEWSEQEVVVGGRELADGPAW